MDHVIGIVLTRAASPGLRGEGHARSVDRPPRRVSALVILLSVLTLQKGRSSAPGANQNQRQFAWNSKHPISRALFAHLCLYGSSPRNRSYSSSFEENEC